MDNYFSKYLGLLWRIVALFLIFIAAFALFLFLMNLLFKAFDFMPWLATFYNFLLLFVPALIFIPAFLIFFNKMKSHEGKFVRYLLQGIFLLMIGGWLICFGHDLFYFFKTYERQIDPYWCFEKLWLIGNVACFFITGMIQALDKKPEKDWLSKYQNDTP